MTQGIGIVVIGRNEGERLQTCLRALPDPTAAVYVDSGSTDDSVAFARGLGVTVVELDMRTGFTAARARNAGLAALRERGAPAFVQMIDGDCELAPGWLEAARAALEAEAGLAVVFGRRRERFPERSLYNRLCDEEWNVPVGEALSCGGDALFRLEPLVEAGGYTESLIAGEEPDLCARMRAAGWRVRRIDAEMTLHDAAITRFGQWWRRGRRGGHAFAELAYRRLSTGDPMWGRRVRGILFWAVLLPALALLALVVGLAGARAGLFAAVALAALYPVQVIRVGLRLHARGRPWGFAFASSLLLLLGKFAEAGGVLRYHVGRLARRSSRLIEYKG